MHVNGQITNVRKESKGNFGGFIHYITVDGFGSEINVGWKLEGKEVGSFFEGDVEQNKYNDWVPAGQGGGNTAPAKKQGGGNFQRSSGGGKGGLKSYPVEADDPQNVIINQNSMAHATALVNGLLGELPDGVDANEIPAILEQRLELALAIAPKITQFSSGRATLDAAKAIVESQKVA